jgi:hypothetical protein
MFSILRHFHSEGYLVRAIQVNTWITPSKTIVNGRFVSIYSFVPSAAFPSFYKHSAQQCAEKHGMVFRLFNDTPITEGMAANYG